MQATLVRHNSPNAFTSAYRHVGLETGVSGASAHQLVAMLFDGVQDSIAQARGAIRARDTLAKGRAIARAVRIVDEGLRGALNTQGGGTLALDLRDLYSYVTLRLTHANLKSDDDALAECARLIQPLRDAWRAIGPQLQAQAR
jgi:flagellar protein FliS